MDANVTTSFRSNGNGYAPRGVGVSHVQVPLPLAHSVEHGEVLFTSETLVGVDIPILNMIFYSNGSGFTGKL